MNEFMNINSRDLFVLINSDLISHVVSTSIKLSNWLEFWNINAILPCTGGFNAQMNMPNVML